jgi:hypothetical protein
MVHRNLFVGVICLGMSAASLAQQPAASSPHCGLFQATLTKPGNPAFHLKAEINDRDGSESGDVEIYWVSPAKWRRTIDTHAFSQTLVVSGDQVSEQDSEDYFPLALQTLLSAMTDPQPLLDALAPDEKVSGHANGGTKPPPFCAHFDPNSSPGMQMICRVGLYKDMETIPGVRGVSFADYQDFKGMKVARLLTARTLTARVTELTDLKEPESSMFSIDTPTPPEKQLRVVTLPESELRALALQPLEIIWPQPLDGATTGRSSYYLSIDRSGNVSATLVVKDTNERANESALRQIEKWKFKPATQDGTPVQAGGILTFDTDTRAWGPANPLTDAEVRKLASNIVGPVFPSGTPSGASCTVRVAIDEEGNLIEAMAGEGTHGLFMPCYHAVQMWVFHPIMEGGKPRPYRGEIKFQAP